MAICRLGCEFREDSAVQVYRGYVVPPAPDGHHRHSVGLREGRESQSVHEASLRRVIAAGAEDSGKSRDGGPGGSLI